VLLGFILVGCRPVDDPPEEEINGPPPSGTEVEPSPPVGGNENGSSEIVHMEEKDFRAVWVASVLNLDFPSRRGLNAEALKREIDDIVNRTSELGLNAIIFQVRPTGDSFYKSDIFPWSQWLSGTQGQGIPDFDPLQYWIDSCRAKGIELHAWLNPYRIIHTNTNSSDPGTLSPDNPVYKNPELAVGWTAANGRKGLFLDPGLPEARQLILDGIIEIIENYDIDGIHIDDYFYPGTDFNDSASFELYGNGMDLKDWRRENVNTLIMEIQATIRWHNEIFDKNIRWGISPSAIWKNDSEDPLGVPVPSTFESYHLLYADSRRWVLEGWVDYICPQIYWYIGFPTASFDLVLDWWETLCWDTDVDLYIGHAAYRENENDQPPNWVGEMVRQLEKTEASDVVKGNVFYRFHSLKGPLGDTIRCFFSGEEVVPRQPVMTLETLSIGMPVRDVTIRATAANARGYNIVGTSIPDIPLYMNGEEVTNRTIEGFFFIFVQLESGENRFTFSQEGQEDVTRIITRSAPSGGGGSSPAVTITQVTTPRYATVNTDEAWLHPSNSTVGGSDWMLERGQQDRVIAEASNNFVKLSCGMWVNKNNVSLRNEREVINNVLFNGSYRRGMHHDMIVWNTTDDVFPAIHVSFDGDDLTLSFGMHTEVPSLRLPPDLSQTIFSNYSSGVNDGIPYYRFTIRNDVNFEGYFIEYINGEVIFSLKKRKTLIRGEMPLAGITIVLDPGHGGEHYGAVGPLGVALPEKELNLINSIKLADRLRELGATVYLTRETDITLSLQERADFSKFHRPDLFLSLHINSVDETTNVENIRGFTVWYRNHGSISMAQTVLDVMHDIIPHTNRHKSLNHANFFVCRPAWAPSVLLEAGFIINIDDFVWLIDPANQDRMADATVQAIIEYFAG